MHIQRRTGHQSPEITVTTAQDCRPRGRCGIPSRSVPFAARGLRRADGDEAVTAPGDRHEALLNRHVGGALLDIPILAMQDRPILANSHKAAVRRGHGEESHRIIICVREGGRRHPFNAVPAGPHTPCGSVVGSACRKGRPAAPRRGTRRRPATTRLSPTRRAAARCRRSAIMAASGGRVPPPDHHEGPVVHPVLSHRRYPHDT